MTAAAVRAEQIRTLFRQSVPILFSHVINSALVSATLWWSARRLMLVGWMGLMAVMTMARIQLRRRYLRAQPGPAEAPRWGRRFVIASTTAGILWGAGGYLLFDEGSMLSQILVTFVIGGMCAAAAGTLASYPPAFVGFIVPALVPIAWRMLALGDPTHLTMAIMVGVYGGALSVVARNTNRTLTEALRLRFENDALLESLSEARQILEQSNRTLEQRVAERTAEVERQGEALRNAHRMEAVGRLAGGIAHDFNNLLTVVLANVGLLLERLRYDEEARASLGEVRDAAGRGADLVGRLLAFSRLQRLAPRVLDLNQVVSDMQHLLGRLIGEHIDVQVRLATGRLLVRADPSQLEQVVINLVTNARDAMPGGGTLTIATEETEAVAPVALEPGSYAVLSVGDTGFGMDSETRRHVFDPFFTTKEPGRGAGLGLATVYGIVEQSGGRVVVESEPGVGSQFRVYLPRATEKVETPAAAPFVPIKPGPATILLAEDEDAVRSVTERMLTMSGYTVLSARDGEHALELAHRRAGRIDLLITDVVMAKLGGPELARRLRVERPAMRVLFISGYPFDQALPSRDPEGGVDQLQKPFTREGLAQRVAAMLWSADHPPADRERARTAP